MFLTDIIPRIFVNDTKKITYDECDSQKTKNPLDGCTFVYLDMGTNIGVQIRKLFEPEKFDSETFVKLNGPGVRNIFKTKFFSQNDTTISEVQGMSHRIYFVFIIFSST